MLPSSQRRNSGVVLWMGNIEDLGSIVFALFTNIQLGYIERQSTCIGQQIREVSCTLKVFHIQLTQSPLCLVFIWHSGLFSVFYKCYLGRVARSYLATGEGIQATLPGDALAFRQNSMVKDHRVCLEARMLPHNIPDMLPSPPHDGSVSMSPFWVWGFSCWPVGWWLGTNWRGRGKNLGTLYLGNLCRTPEETNCGNSRPLATYWIHGRSEICTRVFLAHVAQRNLTTLLCLCSANS